MIVLRKRPHEAVELCNIPNKLEDLQKQVGGYIETVTIAEDCCIICNEEGRLKNLPFNMELCGMEFMGTILVVGVAGEDFCDVSPTAIDLFLRIR